MINPRSMAIVGASDRQGALRQVVDQNEQSGVRMYLVNPNRDEVFGRKAYRGLEDIDDQLDVILAAVPADVTADAVERAAALGVRGAVITAAGFGETDATGKELQRRLVAAADEHQMAICGPNCNGIVNLVSRKSLCARPVEGIRSGGVALVSQSGGLVTAEVAAGAKRMLGFSYLISSGNEAATDLVDYFEYLIDDPAVTAIMMIVEQIRRPADFVAAAYRARAVGKPVIGLKLGRSEVGKRMGASHTGALMGDARDYDALFNQVGILIARDIDDFMDLAQMFSSLPGELWLDGQSIGVLCASGGSAALASDAFEAEGLPLPIDQRLADWMQELIPTNALGNPFDTTGLLYNESGFGKVLDMYMTSDVFDTVLVVSSAMGQENEQFCSPMVEPMVRAAEQGGKRLVVASTTASPLGGWTERWLSLGIGVASGLVPTVRSLKAMERFVSSRHRPAPQAVSLLSPKPEAHTVTVGGHELLSFRDSADLLRSFDIPVAPFVVLEADLTDLELSLGRLPASPSYVVKLADVLHRSDIGAVASGVSGDEVRSAAVRMKAIAAEHDLPAAVLVQPEIPASAEVFLGAQAGGDLGPVVMFGLGGILVEVIGDVSARLAPFTIEDAWDMVGEIRAREIMGGVRGRKPWDVATLVEILVRFGRLVAATHSWIESIEINPLLVSDTGFSAVDVSCVVARRLEPSEGS